MRLRGAGHPNESGSNERDRCEPSRYSPINPRVAAAHRILFGCGCGNLYMARCHRCDKRDDRRGFLRGVCHGACMHCVDSGGRRNHSQWQTHALPRVGGMVREFGGPTGSPRRASRRLGCQSVVCGWQHIFLHSDGGVCGCDCYARMVGTFAYRCKKWSINAVSNSLR